MRTNLKTLYGFTLVGSEGGIGTVEDFYFDDITWRVKFMVADTGAWLTSRRVIISTQSVLGIDCDMSRFHTDLTTAQIRESPEIDTEKHMGPEHEEVLVRHYHLNPHWPEAGMFGIPPFLPVSPPLTEPPQKEIQDTNIHLAVVSEVMGCSVEATDGYLGALDDFMIDSTWRIGELMVKTGGWVMGRRVWVPLDAVAAINWEKNIIRLKFAHKTARKSREGT